MPSKTILSYQGPVSFSTIDLLLSEFKIASQNHDVPFRAYKKMISIMIEALENITRYSEQFNCNNAKNYDLCPSCVINRNRTTIELITRNPIRRSEVEHLRERIDRVNNHNREELKELYRSTINDGKFSARGGAGLGFIEIAKTTGKKLEYSFENL
ncbi:MAG: hypothetical protein EHM46_06790, partial [Bacteroidetes bacterium]